MGKAVFRSEARSLKTAATVQARSNGNVGGGTREGKKMTNGDHHTELRGFT